MKGFFIEIANNLLEPKHRKKMGTAVWEFMWCLDKITKIDEEGMGWIYGGKPIRLKEIKKELGISEPKISKNLNKLKNEGYLDIRRTPYGIVIKVWKAKKRFAQKVGRIAHKVARFALKGKSNIRQDKTIHRQKRASSSKKLKPYFRGEKMRWSKNKWWVLPSDGSKWLEFAGKTSEITWK